MISLSSFESRSSFAPAKRTKLRIDNNATNRVNDLRMSVSYKKFVLIRIAPRQAAACDMCSQDAAQRRHISAHAAMRRSSAIRWQSSAQRRQTAAQAPQV